MVFEVLQLELKVFQCLVFHILLSNIFQILNLVSKNRFIPENLFKSDLILKPTLFPRKVHVNCRLYHSFAIFQTQIMKYPGLKITWAKLLPQKITWADRLILFGKYS